MIIVLQLVPTAATVTLDLFSEVVDGAAADTTPVNVTPIAGVAITNRPGRYSFDLTTTPPGRYEVHTYGVPAFFVLVLNTLTYDVADSWEELAAGISGVFVDQNTLVVENELILYNDETRTVAIILSTGVFDGSYMYLTINDKNKINLTTVTGLTSITNTVTVTIPPIAWQNYGLCSWSLRKTIGDTVLIAGPVIMRYAPLTVSP